MNVSRRWLEAFLRRPLDVSDLTARLAMLGAPVDAVEPIHPGLGDIVVALVEDVRPHPNADRLRLCTVNDGTAERRQVVCGAPNVTTGHHYPFAPIGATLPGGLRIEKRKLRGEYSEGMLCSARELGLGQDHDGLWELHTDAAPGTPLLEAMPLADDRLVVDVTPNRPDLLGHKGIARELSAAYGVPFRLPVIPGAESIDVPPARREQSDGIVGGVSVAIEDAEGCPRFHAAVIRGVTVAPSPEWMRRRLEAAGVRAINNVVDATNYVLLELNQPMHAYDLARLNGPEVTARRAREGEKLETLDGTVRTLSSEMTVIADPAGAIGVAGVMGGAGTEVSDATTDVFLECAYFAPARIRRARRTLNLSTDASYRFERGVDRWNAMEAMRRCIELVLTTAGGTLAEAPLDLWPEPSHPPRIFLRLDRVAQVLGVELTQHQVEQHLVAIGATVVAKPEDRRIAVDVPGWRPDLVGEIDLIEEVARLHGYGEFPSELRSYRVGSGADAPIERAVDHVRRGLVAEGLLEAVTLPVGPQEDEQSVALINPLSSADAWLRRRLLPGLVRQAELNWARQSRDIRLFEIGTVFARSARGADEERHAAGVVSGARVPAHWTAAEPPVWDEWDIKGLLETAVALANPDASVQVDGTAWIARHPDGTMVGWAGALDADSPPWAAP
ncbi:MAG TPA: phenylalanine--tRNA ligase subunit beta, partial [Gemmatimonadales bacterium]|nr:phenylalanine--tRNA ligase subunit beta [Gemmatimonadales bacterium]